MGARIGPPTRRESEPVAKLCFDPAMVHAFRLDRIEDIDSNLDQVRHQVVDLAVAVVPDQDIRYFLAAAL